MSVKKKFENNVFQKQKIWISNVLVIVCLYKNLNEKGVLFIGNWLTRQKKMHALKKNITVAQYSKYS